MGSKRYTEDDLKNLGLVQIGPDEYMPKSLYEAKRRRHGPKPSLYIPFLNKNFSEEDSVRALKAMENMPVMFRDANTEVASISTPLAIFQVDPIGAPRMTRSDQWKTDPAHKNPKQRQRKPVTQYFKFKNTIIPQAKEQGFTMPESQFHVIFILPMPHSWSEKKKNQMNGAPHQQKPDADNMIKAVKDTLCKSDAHIWDYRITKRWGRTGKILIYSL